MTMGYLSRLDEGTICMSLTGHGGGNIQVEEMPMSLMMRRCVLTNESNEITVPKVFRAGSISLKGQNSFASYTDI
jgi:hypothetical protein